MPRPSKGGGRGGARQGSPNTAYSNRTDLNQAKLAPTAVPGQPYGAAGAQLAAQSAIPMSGSPLGIGAAQGPQAQGIPDPSQAPAFTGPPPGQVPDLFAPSDSTDHIMTGVDAGGGQGSSALAPNPFANNSAAAILTTLQSIPNPSPQVAFTKNYLAMQQENQMPQ